VGRFGGKRGGASRRNFAPKGGLFPIECRIVAEFTGKADQGHPDIRIVRKPAPEPGEESEVLLVACLIADQLYRKQQVIRFVTAGQR